MQKEIYLIGACSGKCHNLVEVSSGGSNQSPDAPRAVWGRAGDNEVTFELI